MGPFTRWRAAAAAILALGALTGCQPATISIAYRPASGASFRYVVEVESSAETRLAGQEPSRTTRRSDLEVHHRVLRAGESSVAVEVRLEPASGPTRTFLVRFDRAAQVTEIERVEGLPVEILGDLGLSELFPAAAGAPPDRPLAPGDRWSIDEPLRLTGLRATRLRGDGRLVALGVVDGRQVATVRSTYRLPVQRTVDDPQGELILEGEQRTVATATRDVDDGAVQESSARTTGRFVVTVLPAAGERGAPVQGTLTVEITSRTKRVR